jgi:hypothetical protein
MELKEMLFAGIEISSGNRPITYAALDQDLKVILLERYSLSHTLTHLEQHTNVMLAVNVSFRSRSASAKGAYKVFADLEKKIIQAGFKPYLSHDAPRQWIETYPAECFSALAGQAPFARHTLRGRFQRAAILYEQGLQIKNPGKSFEEITFGGLSAGVMPSDPLYSPSELDALVAAGIAWMLVNKPVNVDLTRKPGRQMILIPRADKNWWKKN